MRFCANLTFLFTEYSTYAERYAAAKAFGFQAAEICFPYNEPLDTLKQGACLPTALINSLPGGPGEFGYAALPSKGQQFQDSMKTSLEYARELGVKRLHIMSGVPRSEDSYQSCLDTLKQNLLSVLPELERSSIVGVIEPINKVTIPGYFLNNYATALELVKSINSPYLKLQLDIFHLQQIQGNLTDFVLQALPHTGHVQIAQVPLRNEPDTPGEVNYQYVLDLIAKEGYDGWVGLEYKPKGSTTDGLAWINRFGLSL